MNSSRYDTAGFKPVLVMGLPILAEIFLRTLIGNVDQFMLSRFSDTAVAAVSNANQVINLGIIVLDVVCVATTIILAQYIGAKQHEKANKLCTLSIGLIAILSVVLSLTLSLKGEFFLNLMHIPPELMAEAKTYLLIVGLSLILQGFFMAYSAIFRSFAMMKEIMYISVGMNIINVAFNYVLINGKFGFPRLGVAGAATATLLSRVVGVVIIAILFVKQLHLHLDFKYLCKPEFKAIKQMLSVGFPAAGDSISYNCMQMVILSFVNICGSKSVTARVYVNMIVVFVFMYTSAIGTATQIHVGYLVGAGNADNAKKLVTKSVLSGIVVSEILSTLLYVFRDSVFTIFTKDTEILSIISSVLLVEIFLELGRAINIVMIKSLLAAGDTKFPLYMAVLSQWGTAVPLAYFFGLHLGMGLTGIWIGLAVDEWCRALAFILRWRSNKWKEKRLI
ncbi:MAG: MATE family efflux transporter [Oscillospiraceae bacterium]